MLTCQHVTSMAVLFKRLSILSVLDLQDYLAVRNACVCVLIRRNINRSGIPLVKIFGCSDPYRRGCVIFKLN